jgi:hypothetical protein
MKKIFSFIKRCRFLILLVAVFIIFDLLLGAFFGGYIIKSGNFWLNDDEITRRDHPEETWDKVFYGNSAVIAAYREELSESGYINYGLDYGSMTDLSELLSSKRLQIPSGGSLVVGLNWAAMFDNMETNPNYFWHRRALEPYSYFQRDRLYEAVSGKIDSLLTGEPWADGSFITQEKSLYYASLSEDAIWEKVAVYAERYWSTGVEGCSENLAALGEVCDMAAGRGIRLRVVLMTWNPTFAKPDVVTSLEDEIAKICAENGVELLDLSEAFDADCFHDLGHLNYEYGSRRFMEVIDPWLSS